MLRSGKETGLGRLVPIVKAKLKSRLRLEVLPLENGQVMQGAWQEKSPEVLGKARFFRYSTLFHSSLC